MGSQRKRQMILTHHAMQRATERGIDLEVLQDPFGVPDDVHVIAEGNIVITCWRKTGSYGDRARRPTPEHLRRLTNRARAKRAESGKRRPKAGDGENEFRIPQPRKQRKEWVKRLMAKAKDLQRKAEIDRKYSHMSHYMTFLAPQPKVYGRRRKSLMRVRRPVNTEKGKPSQAERRTSRETK